MEERLNYSQYMDDRYYCDMVEYKEGRRTGVFNHFSYNSDDFENIADYLENHGIELYHYYETNDRVGLEKDILKNSNDIIIDIDIIAEEQKALLTFFDKSRQLIDIKNLE